MENRLKERLTGAAILVALIVLLVPEMFHGQRSDATAPTGSGDGPPIRSYTIDLSNSPASTAPLQSTPPAATGPSSSGNSDGSGGSTTAPKPTNSAAPAVPSPPPPSTPSAGRPPAVSPAAPVTTPKPSTTVAAASHAGGGWSVQLGLFAQHDNAERMVRSAQAKGFSASVSDKDGKGLYHVQVVNLTDRAAALAMQGRLHDQGFPAAVVPPH